MTSKTIIRLGGYGPSTTTHSRGLKYIGDSLQSLFGNRVDIKYIWNVMDLGYGSDAVLWLTECGMIDIVYMSTTALTSRVQDLEILDLPFLFSDNDTARAAYDGALGKHMRDAIEEKCNFLVLGYFENGFRHLSNWKKQITKPEDLLGMSIRTLGSTTHNRTFEILGMHPKSMRLDEAKLAIEKHEVDAQENPFANTMTYGIHRVHKFHTLSNHFYLSRGIYANPQNYNAWPDDIQKAIPYIIKEAVPFQRNLAVKEEKIARQEIENIGGIVHELTVEDNKAFRRVLAPIYKEVRDRLDESLLTLLD
jgi:tripartite ATP-independent transporter DctP family solute receptor